MAKAEHKDSSDVVVGPYFGALPPVHDIPLPRAGYHRPQSELLSEAQVTRVRKANAQGQLKSNFWYEVSRIAMWATTGLIALSVMSFSSAAAAAAVPLWLSVGGAVAAAGVLITSSQYARRIVVDRVFDVQDFQMQRQAALVGQSVEQAVAPALTARTSTVAALPSGLRSMAEAGTEILAESAHVEKPLAVQLARA